MKTYTIEFAGQLILLPSFLFLTIPFFARQRLDSFHNYRSHSTASAKSSGGGSVEFGLSGVKVVGVYIPLQHLSSSMLS
ncbi:hypothetical protein BDV25DRAFT_28728 [Aspergillus avenaceus]|uniref:Uncharacterized protein n=1 Tax=Aspergillus avenaceus TaxID=36643 RepID=A0A5N6TN09_ASPAV|nr:hypothetical protein BDV25DRAFT_28728 [Aspergillus avenaceus]